MTLLQGPKDLVLPTLIWILMNRISSNGLLTCSLNFLTAKNVTSSSIDNLIDLKLSKGMANIKKIKACKGNSSCVNPLVDDHFNISSSRKNTFLELFGTSKTTDIEIEIDDPLKNSTTGKNDFLATSKTAEVTK